MKYIAPIFLLLLSSVVKSEVNVQQLQTILESEVQGVAPGVAVGVVQNGITVFEGYVGYANLEHQVKVSPKTRFNIASNAKQYTALAALKLSQEGKLRLDDDLNVYLSEYFQENKPMVTINNLINHSSGIRDVYDLWTLQGKTWWQLFVGNTHALELLKQQKDLNFEPGTEYLYSNSNYLLLAAVVEKASGKAFSDYVGTMFASMGMNETTFLTNYMNVIPNKARPYGYWKRWIEYPSVTSIHGDGGLFTTLADQLVFEKILQSKKFPNASLFSLSTGLSPISGTTIKNYGFGVMFGKLFGNDIIYHDGNTGAYNASFLRIPEQKTAIVVMSNNGQVSTNNLARRVAKIIFGGDSLSEQNYPMGPVRTEPKPDIETIQGHYRSNDGMIIEIYERDGRLYRGISEREPVELVHQKDNLYVYQSDQKLRMSFSLNSKGKLYVDNIPPGPKSDCCR